MFLEDVCRDSQEDGPSGTTEDWKVTLLTCKLMVLLLILHYPVLCASKTIPPRDASSPSAPSRGVGPRGSLGSAGLVLWSEVRKDDLTRHPGGHFYSVNISYICTKSVSL